VFGVVLCGPKGQSFGELLRVNPIGVNFNAGPFDGQMALVPEGQADRSQARSAWVTMHRGPRPGGTVEVMVRDICRRNGVHAAFRNARYSC
jgi:hypothetical protein